MGNSKPKVRAMLVCDHIITEGNSGKNSLIGVFETINVPLLPAVHPVLYVYVSLTEALGKYDFRLELINPEDKQVMLEDAAIHGVEIKNESGSFSLVFAFKMLTFDRDGKYEFRLFANEELCEKIAINLKKV
jgi:hypothetical protein